MSHIAIQESLEGKAVDWMEKVSDEQYRNDRSKEQTMPDFFLVHVRTLCYIKARTTESPPL